MNKVAVIGSGAMGNGIAHVFAQHGYKVSLVDISEDVLKKAINTIDKNLSRQVEKGTITNETKLMALKNISIFADTEKGVKDAELVVEAATENVDLKLKIFQDLDKFSPPSSILATNTSSISITRIASV